MLLQILNIVTNPKCCCYLFLFPLASLFRFQFRFQLQFWFWFRPILVPILESYFIKLFDADLQCEFIRTFFMNRDFMNFLHFFCRFLSTALWGHFLACPTTNLNLLEIHGTVAAVQAGAAGSEMIKQMQFPIVWTPQCKRNLIFRKICIPAKTFQSFVAAESSKSLQRN